MPHDDADRLTPLPLPPSFISFGSLSQKFMHTTVVSATSGLFEKILQSWSKEWMALKPTDFGLVITDYITADFGMSPGRMYILPQMPDEVLNR